MRRIFPSLVAMLALCLAYVWLVLFPAEYRQLGSHAAWGAVFLQNLAFWRESGYFDTSATLKPLLHLWSLAVEEQVYLVFPAVVLLAWRIRWPMLPVLATLMVASLVAGLVATGEAPSAAFFLTPFRTWEFLAGSILAWIHDHRGAPTARSWRVELASWGGLALLAFGLAWIAEGEGFPGWRAAIPVVGTTLILAVEGPPGSAPIGLARDAELDQEWQSFRFDFAATKADSAARLRFNLNASDAAVELADIEFAPRRWYLRVGTDARAAFTGVAGKPEAVRVTIDGTTDPKTPWTVRLHGPPFAVEEGQAFLVRFRARSDSPRTIVAKAGLSCEPWSAVGFYKVVALGPEWREHEFRFQATATVADAHLEFMLGADRAAVEIGPAEVLTLN